MSWAEVKLSLFFQVKRWAQKNLRQPVHKDLTQFPFEVGAIVDLPYFESVKAYVFNGSGIG